MTQDDAIQKVVTQYTVLNPTVINAVNKRAKTMAVFKEEVFEWQLMQSSELMATMLTRH